MSNFDRVFMIGNKDGGGSVLIHPFSSGELAQVGYSGWPKDCGNGVLEHPE
jgi:hypothetical protein